MKKILTISLFILLALSMTACTNSWVCEATGGRVACPVSADTTQTLEEPETPADPEQPAAPANPENPTGVETDDATCVTGDWLTERIDDTKTVSELISDLDRLFNETRGTIGGAWTQEQAESTNGYTIPAGTEFHTDLFENVRELPEGVTVVRTQGGWGVYRTTVAFKVPLPNGGGRWIRICDPSQISDLPSQTACISNADLNNITGSSDPVKEFNKYFESAGYAYGASIDEGGDVPVGTIFLGTFPETSIPAGIVNLADGYIWQIDVAVVAPNGGRYITACASR